MDVGGSVVELTMRRQLMVSTAALLIATSLPVLGWCGQDYGWAYRPHVATFLDLVVVFFVLPGMVLSVLLRLGRVAAQRWSRPKGNAERRRGGGHRLQAS